MTKQRKNEKKAVLAKAITAMHLQGEKGPAKTTPLHGKKWGYRSNPEVAKRIAEMSKAPAEDSSGVHEKTSGKKILRSAGRASQEA